jgi:hypothetical protein
LSAVQRYGRSQRAHSGPKISRGFTSFRLILIRLRRGWRFDAFFLRDLGYVDGQTITIDYLSAEGRGERYPALTAFYEYAP